jgi:hypothetical protein
MSIAAAGPQKNGVNRRKFCSFGEGFFSSWLAFYLLGWWDHLRGQPHRAM